MDTFGWDQMADWWDKHIGEEGGVRLLDVACGNGYLSRRFARQGAIVTAVDTNAPLVERARTREAQELLGITYHVADAARLEMLEDGMFDLVVCNMALMDIEDAAGPSSRFILSPPSGGK